MIQVSIRRWVLFYSVAGWLQAGVGLAQVFGPGHLAVLRAGDGVQSLVNSGNSLFVDEYTQAGALVRVTLLPDTGAQAILQSGTASSEGGLTRSLDHSMLVVAGYNVSRGTVSGSLAGQSATAIPRAVATLDAFLNYELFPGGPTLYNSNNIRGAVTDGTNSFWTAGDPGGTFYFSPPQLPVDLQTAADNTRQIKIIGGSLYFSTQAGTPGIYTFSGSGPPTGPDSTVPVFGTGAKSQPSGFALNRDLTIAYVADQRSTAGGIQKWTNSGVAWGLAYTFSTGGGAFDVAVNFSGSNPILFATTAESKGNRLISMTDSGPLSLVHVLATAGPNEVLRGLDFVPDLRPTILGQPQSQTVPPGSQATFAVQVQSHYALMYQWQKNGTNIPGAISSVLTLQNVSAADQGGYQAAVTNAYGTVTSAEATLTVTQVLAPPTITSQPQDQTVNLGGTATLSVTATGTQPFAYQWQFNGMPMPSRTNSTLILDNLGPGAQGGYQVMVSSPGGSTNSRTASLVVASPVPSFVAYTAPGQIYSQNFDSLPNPGASSVNADNPVPIAGTTYGLADPFDFTFPILPNSVDPTSGIGLGGLALSNSMPGWYGLGQIAPKLGASAGDESAGGIISFGLTNSPNAGTNRALGLLATSSTGSTAFGLKLINQTGLTLNQITIRFTGELWRQAAVAKPVLVGYWIDPSAINSFSTNLNASFPELQVSFSPDPAATNPVPVDGTAALDQVSLGVANQAIADWPPGAALWLSWQMPDPSGKGQGVAIDNFSFSATQGQSTPPAQLSLRQSGTNVLVSWPALPGYQLQSSADLSAPQAWAPVSEPVNSSNGSNSVLIPIGPPAQFFRLRN